MSKLPYTYTICPPGPEPKQYTASCREAGELLKNSPDGNIAIKHNDTMWDSWTNRPLSIAPIEDMVSEMVQSLKETKK